jgi:hypothetical protein
MKICALCEIQIPLQPHHNQPEFQRSYKAIFDNRSQPNILERTAESCFAARMTDWA